MKTSKILLILLLASFALYVRIDISSRVFPAQSDATHFIEGGIRMAQNDRHSISGYWSFGPQFIVKWAYERGCSPHRVLQGTTIAAGVILVLAGTALLYGLSRSFLLALLFGMFTATNPSLIDSSVSGLSESPAIATFFAGASLIVWGWRRASRWMPVTGAAVIALAVYYRPFELVVTVGMFGLVALLIAGRQWRYREWITIGCMAVAFFLVTVPYQVISKTKGATTASSVKLVNIAFGVHGYDSKVISRMHMETEKMNPLIEELRLLEREGSLRYIAMRRNRIIRNYMSNLIRGIRQLNSHLFTGSVRVGTVWFALLQVAMLVAILRNNEWRFLLAPFLVTYCLIALYSTSFVHPRWSMQGVPYLLMVLAGGACMLRPSFTANRWMLGLGVMMLACFISASTLSMYESTDDRWRELNLYDVADRLRAYADENDRIMAFGVALSPLFYEKNFENLIRMPYGSLNEVERYTEAHRVDVILVNDSMHLDYPIHTVFDHDADLPRNWRVVDVFEYTHTTRFGSERQRYMVIRCDQQGKHDEH